jgi:uncharacterized protein (TIGR02145 family)
LACAHRDGEWTTLTDILGGSVGAGGKLKETGTHHWQSPNTGATNESGFTALPGGARYYDVYFYYIGFYGIWWSSAEYNSDRSFGWGLDYITSNSYMFDDNKRFGFSVRCLRD